MVSVLSKLASKVSITVSSIIGTQTCQSGELCMKMKYYEPPARIVDFLQRYPDCANDSDDVS